MSDNDRPLDLEDDATERVSLLLRHRLPWLVLGLLGGILVTYISSRFELVLEKNIHLAFFIPIIVYMADAVGTQTENVYVRNLGRGNVNFITYMIKESILGVMLGGIFGCIMGVISFLWFKETEVALTVGLAMFVTIAIAPIFALLVPAFFQREHTDPAITAGPFTTITQDVISLLLYLLIATIIILR
jgi:magnesium transporter